MLPSLPSQPPPDSFQRTPAVRQTRLLLARAGLTGPEADAWLLRMRDEFARGNLQTDQDQAAFCEQLMQEIAAGRGKGLRELAPQWADMKMIVLNAIGSALGGTLVLGAGTLLEPEHQNAGQLPPAGSTDDTFGLWSVEWVDAPGSYGRVKVKNPASIERLARRALQITEDRYGFEDERTAKKLMHVGRLLDAQKRYAEAEPFLERAFGIEKALLGINHPHTGVTLINLGLHDYAQGRYAQAAGLFREGLKGVESSGAEDIDTSGALYNFGVALDVQGYHAEAEPLLRRALAIAEKAASDPPPSGYLPLCNQYVLLLRGRLRANVAAQHRRGRLARRQDPRGPTRAPR